MRLSCDNHSTELRHFMHDTLGCDYDMMIAVLHVPTGQRVDRRMAFLSRRHMLELLDVWNGQQPGVWVYWSMTER